MPEKEKSTFLSEILVLVLAVLFVRFWTGNTVLTAYSLQLTASIVIVYFVLRLFLSKKDNSAYNRLFLETVVFTAVLLLVISATNGLGSPLFFLIYFYLFAVALLFEPVVTFTLTITLAFYFFEEANSFSSILQLFSLFLISLLAIYFGKQYLKLLESQEKIKILFKSGRLLLKQKEKTEIQVASQETNALLWLSLNFKDSLLKIIHYAAEILADGRLNTTQKDNLEKIHSSAKDILKSGEKLQEKIDKETD